MFRRIRRSLILGVGALLVLAGTVLAVVPTGWTDSPTDSRKIYGNPGVLETQRTLTWKFASTSYPTWFQNAIKTTLGTNWGHTAGASRMPKFSYNQWTYDSLSGATWSSFTLSVSDPFIIPQ